MVKIEQFKPQAIIFDADGTLFPTEKLGVCAWVAAARQLGFPNVDRSRFHCIVGQGRAGSMAAVRKEFGPAFPVERAQELRDELTMRHFDKRPLRQMPGLPDLLGYCEANKIAVAVGTCTRRERAGVKLKAASLQDKFKVIVTADDVSKLKPDPEIYLKAAEILGVDPNQCAVVEDSEVGIEAAHRAGMIPIHVPDLVPATPRTKQLAHAILSNLTEVRDMIASWWLKGLRIESSSN